MSEPIARRANSPWPSTDQLLAANSAITLLTLVLIVSGAFYMRYQVMLLAGGLESDYQAWAIQNYFGGISRIYLHSASELLKGVYSGTAYPPGYAMFIAALSALGLTPQTGLRVAQIAIDSAGVLVLFWLARNMFVSATAGLVSGLAYAGLPLLQLGSTTLLAESLAPFLMVSILALMWRVHQRANPLRCGFVGVLTAFCALVRADMVLMLGPVALWAWLQAKEQRLPAVAALGIGAAVFLAPWGIYNYAKNGEFRITTSAAYYGLWSGLGQIPNDHGYYVDDVRRNEEMKKLGIEVFSSEMNAHYRDRYFNAWRDHPDHAVKSIAFRWASIPFFDADWPESQVAFKGLYRAFTDKWGFVILLATCLYFLKRAQFAVAFIIALPLLYALGGIGLVYVEPRYVRYVQIGYVLALGAAFSIAAQWLRVVVPSRLTQIANVAALIGVAAIIFVQSSALTAAVARKSIAMDLEKRFLVEGDEPWQNFGIRHPWQKAVQEVLFQYTNRGLAVVSDKSSGHYQLQLPLPAKKGETVAIEFELEVENNAGAGIAILKADGSEFLAKTQITGPGTKRQRLIAAQLDQPAPWIVLMNSNSEPKITRFVLRNLRISVR